MHAAGHLTIQWVEKNTLSRKSTCCREAEWAFNDNNFGPRFFVYPRNTVENQFLKARFNPKAGIASLFRSKMTLGTSNFQ